jgi:hypothetical protein
VPRFVVTTGLVQRAARCIEIGRYELSLLGRSRATRKKGMGGEPSGIEKAMGYVYNKMQFYGVRKPGRYDSKNWGTNVPQRPARPSPRYEDKAEGEEK